MKRFTKKVIKTLSLLLTFTLLAAPLTVAAAPAESTPSQAQAQPQQRRIIGYFCEWRDNELGQYYTVHDIPWGKVTHINYAFAAVGDDNRIQLMDEEAAIQRVYEGQDPSLPYLGHFNLLNTYKQQYPGTKTLISIGGWSASGNFFPMTDTQTSIDTFADSVVDFLRQYGFDGADIDMEYPSSTGQSGNPLDFDVSEPRRGVIYDHFLMLMETLREKLDEASEEDNKQYLLTMAAPASSWILGGMELGEYAKYLDYLNMMTYDFHGSWNGYVGPQSAVFSDPRDTETAQLPIPVLSIDWAFKYFRGVLPADKINIGVPYYTRGWKNVTPGAYPGGLYGRAAMSGGGADGIDGVWNDPPPAEPSGTNSIYHMMNLLDDPSLGYELFWDDVTQTSYVWNESKKVFLTHEDERSMAAKIQYVIDNGIGGYMVWELSGDYKYDEEAGEYVSGDTLTTLAHDMFAAAPPLIPDQGIRPTEDQIGDFAYSFTGNYDHPNYTYAFTITNNTGADIPGGYTLEFDFPNSAIFQPPWGGTIESQQDNGIFTHYVLRMPAYATLANGGSFTLQGMIKLCFTGGFKNIQINGLYTSQEFPTPAAPVIKPVISGADNVTITLGSTFDPMAGVTAYDEVDGDLTDQIVLGGAVNTSVSATYDLVYSVTNSQSQTAEVTRKVTVAAPQVVKPVINGADDIQINVGDPFNPMTGVTASDAVDGDLTSAVTVTGNVNTQAAGTYTLTYAVTNSSNQTTIVGRTVTVTNPPPVYPAWVLGTVYVKGNIVTYQGQLYIAKWWTNSEVPGVGQWGAWDIYP